MCYKLWYNAPPAGSIVGELYHKLLLKMGVIIARNMFEVIGIINKPLLLHPVGVYINDVRSSKYHIIYTMLFSLLVLRNLVLF